jgi:transposase
VSGELVVLRAATAELRQVIEAKDAEIIVLRAQVEELRQVGELAARVQANSKNSSRPPSSDGLGRPAPKSLRKKTGRGPGRPMGQPGMTLGLSDRPGHVIRHEPGGCAGCGAGLSAAEEAGVERRQVTGAPPVRPEITEHQIIARRCGCGKVTRGQAPEGVTAPVQYGPRISGIGAYLWHGQFLSKGRTCQALGEMFGALASPGTVAAMARRIAGFPSPALAEITQALLACEVAHFDETGFRVAGKLAWVHSASSGKYVLVTVHSRRGTEAMDAAGVLPGFAGIACHDAWAPYDKYGQVAGHALCCAHLLRELVAVTGYLGGMPPRPARPQLGLFDNPVRVFSLEELAETVRARAQAARPDRRRAFPRRVRRTRHEADTARRRTRRRGHPGGPGAGATRRDHRHAVATDQPGSSGAARCRLSRRASVLLADGGSRALAALASGRSATPTSGPADRGAGNGRLRERRTAAGDRSTLANPAAPAAYCLVTWMLVALVVSVYPAVWLVNDPLSEPNVKAV